MNERKYCVYMHKNKFSGKAYIGATCLSLNARWGKNGNQYKRQKHFYSDILKYGWHNFEHIIIAEGLNNEEAKILERKYITLHLDNCYNIKRGGEQGTIKYITQEEYEKRYIEMKNKMTDYCKSHHEEMAKKSKEYYHKNEEYRKRKIEYQREYRKKHKNSEL